MVTVRVLGASLTVSGAELVTVEGRFEKQERERTEVVLTGLPDPVLRESRGRLVSALEAQGYRLPGGRLFLNLVPSGRRKHGEMLDLPLALAAAAAGGHLDPRWFANALFLGELGIDGALHPVPGGLAAARMARDAGIVRVFAPGPTALEAACVQGVQAFAPRRMDELVAHLARPPQSRLLEPVDAADALRGDGDEEAGGPNLDDVRGHDAAKLALVAAACGGHSLLFVGPPGTGKSMLARRLGPLVPPLEHEERLEITSVLSAAGRWPGGLARTRPFRAPHHTISYAGLVGGGSPPAPGEVTLAHRGVLFLDELPEFRRDALEALRQPLESGRVGIGRAGKHLELPARFLLVCAMNPCPCGYEGHPRTPCRCAPSRVARYRGRISGPLLDRIELRVRVEAPEIDALLEVRSQPGTGQVPHAEWLRRARRAQARTRARQGALSNARLGAAQLDEVAPVCARSRTLLERAMERQGWSARAVQAVRRVARTLADLEDEDTAGPAHLAQALALRSGL